MRWINQIISKPLRYDEKTMQLNRLTLSFEKDQAHLEPEFRRAYYENEITHVRISILVGLMIYSLFGILDGMLAPGTKYVFWAIRFGFILPLAVVGFLFSYWRHFERYMQFVLAIMVMSAGFGITAMIVMASPPLSYSYYAGLILVFIYGYTYLRIRFIWGTLAGWVIVAAYEIAAVWIVNVPLDVLINNNFFFIFSNILGMLASYSIEYSARKDFFQAKLLETQQVAIAATNQELENRVAERTAQLETANQQLKTEIAEREQVEKALLRSQEKYRLLADNATDVIWMLDIKTMRYTYFSPSVITTRGYTPEEALALSVEQSVTPESLEKAWPILSEELEKEAGGNGDPERYRTIEIEQYRKDGGTIWAEVKMRFIRDSSGKAIGILGASRDITNRKVAETALRESEEQYKDLVENLNDVIYAVDTDGKVTFVSSVIESILGYVPSELIGKSFMRFVHEDYRERLSKHFHDVITGKKLSNDYRVYTKSGETVWLRSSSRPIYRDGVIIGLRGMLTDITERKQTQEQLLQFEKMAALGRLVAGVAHEINTPIGVGITASSYLEDNTEKYREIQQKGEMTSEDLSKYFRMSAEASNIIHANLRRAADLINSFKQVAVDQTTEAFRSVRLKQYIEEILMSLRPEYKRTRHRISVICDPDIEFYSSPGAFSQILTNLVINSLTHGFENMDDGEITITAEKNQERLILKYADNGKGMDTETMRQMYDPFFTTNRSHGGSGLGMHIVYNLVSQTLGGRIECQSCPGEGVAFEIIVPVKSYLSPNA